MRRTKNPEEIAAAIALYPDAVLVVDVQEWAADDKNYAIAYGDSIGLFEEYFPGVYDGHYFFRHRGKEARDLAIRMLREMFSRYEAKVIRGLVPIEHKASLWMTRHLGFKDYGEVNTNEGRHVLFVMTSDEFTQRYQNG